MKKAKRIELIVANIVLLKSLEVLDHHDVNYTVFKDITGKGERGAKSAENVLTILTNTYILVVCGEEKAEPIIKDMEILLQTYGGTYFITDTFAWDDTGL